MQCNATLCGIVLHCATLCGIVLSRSKSELYHCNGWCAPVRRRARAWIQLERREVEAFQERHSCLHPGGVCVQVVSCYLDFFSGNPNIRDMTQCSDSGKDFQERHSGLHPGGCVQVVNCPTG